MKRSRREEPGFEPVGSFPTNESPYGVRDLVGGVWEWIGDGRLPPTNLRNFMLREGSIERTIRGGSWLSPAQELRADTVMHIAPTVRQNNIGFRLVKPLEAQH
jgi:formylglycine-generating enzyme required for sulfatase activity